jgi:tol-pal system protein YbgF
MLKTPPTTRFFAMNRLTSHGLAAAGLVAAALAAGLGTATVTLAQDGGSPSLLDRMFGNNNSGGPQTTGQDSAQNTPAELVLRIDRLEAQIRGLTGTIEQLQYRNRLLEGQIRAMGAVPGNVQGAVAGAPTASGQPTQPVLPGMQPAQPMQPGMQPMRPAAQAAPVAPPASVPGRRSDVFDPSQHPNAPGAPHALGSLPAGQPSIAAPEPPVGAPGGRGAGAPLDLSTLAQPVERRGSLEPGAPAGNGPLPPPPSRNPSATGAVAAVAPPSETPKDTYDLAYGYMLRKDYALAEEAFHSFLKKYPTDRRAADAEFWLGESLFQRQRYDAAASAFLDLSTKHKSHSKAPEALLRLAQSLAAMKQKEMACATLAEVSRKYPRAPGSVKQGVDREQKRVHC